MTDADDASVDKDAVLVARIRAGNARAFEELFRGHWAALCRFVDRYLQNHGATEDLVQGLFADVWARRATWEPRHGPRAYLFAAARNRALNVRKHAAVERDWERDEAASDSRSPARPDELLDTADLQAMLDAAIDALPERCRLVMHLRWREQMSYAEIADVMQISVKGVENQLSRGLRALRERLKVDDP